MTLRSALGTQRRRPGNPNWGKQSEHSQPAKPTKFERLAASLGLRTFAQQRQSAALHAWVRLHKGSRYVPEELLKAWGLEVGELGP